MKPSPDTEEKPKFAEEEVERAMKRMKRYKAHGMDRITSDMKLEGGGGGGGQSVLTFLTNIFNDIIITDKADSWQLA